MLRKSYPIFLSLWEGFVTPNYEIFIETSSRAKEYVLGVAWGCLWGAVRSTQPTANSFLKLTAMRGVAYEPMSYIELTLP